MPLLELAAVATFYGRIQALRAISISVEDGEKAPAPRGICRPAPPQRGQIRLRGQSITGLNAERIVALGVGHVPEGRRVFARMSVRDNLMLGAYIRRDG